MFLFTHVLIASNKNGVNGVDCKYIAVVPGKQKVNRSAILNAVFEVMTHTYPEQCEAVLVEVNKNPSKLKSYVHIDKRMFDLLTRYVQRKPMLVYADIELRLNVYVIGNKVHIHVYQVESKYQTATGSLTLPQVKDSRKPLTIGDLITKHIATKPKTLGEIVAEQVKINTPKPATLTFEDAVNKVQTAIKDGTTVLYCKQPIRDIGLCNAIEPQLFIFKTEGMIVKRLKDLNINEFCKSFTYTKTAQLF